MANLLVCRCSMIVHVEYRCPECDKVFNCPANLASHRRWHKPKNEPNCSSKKSTSTDQDNQDAVVVEDLVGCDACGKKFKKMSTLRKHIQTHGSTSSVVAPTTPSSPSNNNNNGKGSYSIAQLLSPSKANSGAKCSSCLATFANSVELAAHRVTVHNSLPTSPCGKSTTEAMPVFSHRPPPLISIAAALSTR